MTINELIEKYGMFRTRSETRTTTLTNIAIETDCEWPYYSDGLTIREVMMDLHEKDICYSLTDFVIFSNNDDITDETTQEELEEGYGKVSTLDFVVKELENIFYNIGINQIEAEGTIPDYILDMKVDEKIVVDMTIDIMYSQGLEDLYPDADVVDYKWRKHEVQN